MHFAVLAMFGFIVAIFFAFNTLVRLIEGRVSLVPIVMAFGMAYGTFAAIGLASQSMDAKVGQYANTTWGVALEPDEAKLVRSESPKGNVTVNADHPSGSMDVTFSCMTGILNAWVDR